MATKNHKKIGYFLGKCVGPVLLTLLGVLLVFFPDSGSATVATVLGWVLAAAGIVLIIVCGAGAEFFGVAAGVVAREASYSAWVMTFTQEPSTQTSVLS